MMNRKYYIFIIIFLFFFSLKNEKLLGQTSGFRLARKITSDLNSGIQYWRAGNDQAYQVAVPITFIYPVSDRLRFDISNSPSFSGIKAANNSQLNGLSDTRLRGSYVLGEDAFMFTFGVNLPSGKNMLSGEELTVANVLSIHALNFQTPLLGQGLDASAGFVMARPMGGFVFGLGAGYLMRGKFKPFSDFDLKYNPGDEVSFSLGLDRPLNREDKIMLDLGYTIYTEDTSNDTKVYQAGNKFTAQAMAYLPGEVWTFVVSALERYRGKNKIGSDKLTPERLNSNGNELELTGMVILAMNRRTSFGAVVEGKFYSNNAYGFGGANVGGIGVSYGLKLSHRIQLDAGFRYYMGVYNTTLKNVNLLGIKLLTGLKIYL